MRTLSRFSLRVSPLSLLASPALRLPALLVSALFVSAAVAQIAPMPTQAQRAAAQTETETASPRNAIEAKIADGQCSTSIALLTTYLSANPQDDRALFDLGYCQDATGDTTQAAQSFQKALAVNPKQFESHLALGLLEMQSNKAGAEANLTAATLETPNPPNPAAKAQAYRALARLLVKSDPQSASTALVAALRLTPETPDDTLLAAQIAENAGSLDIAEQEYHHLLTEEPDNLDATTGLVQLLMREQKYTEAEPILTAALHEHPDSPSLNAAQAALFGAEGKMTEAIGALEKLHGLYPANQKVAGMLADAYLQAGQLDQAAELYPQVIAAEPTNTSALDSYGQVLIRKHQYAQALTTFEQALKVQSDDIDALSGIAFAAQQVGDYAQELTALNHRAKLTPNTPATLFLTATAYDHLRQYKQAASYYKQFLASSPGKTFANEIWQAQHRLMALPNH